MTDDKGVLGNLPRSRPGQRSEKRAGQRAGKTSAEAASQTDSRAERSGSKAAAPAPGAQAGPDPVGSTIRGVAGLAVTGARVANGVAREVLRRLPRP